MKTNRQNENTTGNETRTEQVLRASELSYRRLFEAAKDGSRQLIIYSCHDSNPRPASS